MENSRKKMSIEMKILVGLTAAAALVSVLYLLAGDLAAKQGMSYRMWARETGYIILMMILPLLLLLLIWTALNRRWKKGGWRRTLLAVGMAFLYLFWMLFAGLFLFLGIQEEHRLVGDLLISNEAPLLGKDVWVYYRRKGIFFRVPGELEDSDLQRYLEEKYGCSFTALGETDVYERVLFEEESHPDVSVAVAREGWELKDNYVEVLTEYYLSEGYRELGLVRAGEIRYGFWGPYFYLSLEDEEDIEAFSEDASRLLQYVTGRTPLYETYRGVLCFLHMEGEQSVTGSIPFGRLSRYDTQEKDYWTKPERVAEYVTERYKEGMEYAARQQEYQASVTAAAEEDGEDMSGAVDIWAETEREIQEEELVDSQEEAARRIYEEVLEGQGYSYEVCYNAKGALYIDLGRVPVEQEGDEETEDFYRYTLVYDRLSKNGACELFVLYREYHRVTETEIVQGNTVILNFYAVETETGRVIAADKTAWAEVGSDAYREATGE